jgi:DNA-binding NarL/FixJ family response regulator
MSLTVIIADDYELIRKGILSVLQAEPDLAVMGECSTGEELLELVSSCCPGVAIVDVAIRKLDIFAITKRIKALSPSTRVIVQAMPTRNTCASSLTQESPVMF